MKKSKKTLCIFGCVLSIIIVFSAPYLLSHRDVQNTTKSDVDAPESKEKANVIHGVKSLADDEDDLTDEWDEIIGLVNSSEFIWHAAPFGGVPYGDGNMEEELSDLTPFYVEYEMPENIHQEWWEYDYDRLGSFIYEMPFVVYNDNFLDYRYIGEIGFNVITDMNRPYLRIISDSRYNFDLSDIKLDEEERTTSVVRASDMDGNKYKAILSHDNALGVCIAIMIRDGYINDDTCEKIAASIRYKTGDEEHEYFDCGAKTLLNYLTFFWSEQEKSFEDKYDVYYDFTYDYYEVPRLNVGVIGLPVYQWYRDESQSSLAQLQFEERLGSNTDLWRILVWVRNSDGYYYKAVMNQKLILYRDTGEVRWQDEVN